MSLVKLQGSLPASLCPFRADCSVDEDAFAAHVRWLAEASRGGGIVCNGHAGEVASLTRQERKRVVEIAVREAKGKAPVVAGVYTDSPLEAVEFARDSESAGADAILLFPPPVFGGGGNRTEVMVVNYARTVAAAIRIGVVIFQFPIAGLGYPTEILLRLLEIPNVVGVKEGSDHLPTFERNLRAIKKARPEVSVVTTNNTMLFASTALGADGILSGSGSVVADLHAELFAAVRGGDLRAAQKVNDRIWPLTQVFYCDPIVNMHNRMKVALEYLGRQPKAVVRPPLEPLTAEERGRIIRGVQEAGLQ
ncbi:MAG: dihydrodipicolinate synthase family protein [Deltaproteobacteria bacterium]|nr:MAG: dihydrodipicolinate synthase family protein [Deltaproteobacteria bacterium]